MFSFTYLPEDFGRDVPPAQAKTLVYGFRNPRPVSTGARIRKALVIAVRFAATCVSYPDLTSGAPLTEAEVAALRSPWSAM
jgi:hypothetical protein